MPDADLSCLPVEYRRQAIRTGTGEVMWPRQIALEVVTALAANGKVVLGLDLRSDGTGTTPMGLSTEIPWSAVRYQQEGGITAEVARDEALAALERQDMADVIDYDWVLITWADA